MTRAVSKIIFLSILAAAGSAGVMYYNGYLSPQQVKIRELEQDKKQLEQIVERLSTEKRVADVLVTDQKTVDGKLQTTLLFVEYAKDGSTLPPKSFTIEGKMVHVNAMVIKFDKHF